MVDLKSHLNSSQYQAVTTTDKPVLVIAGAGSGKTRVIEYRTLHLVQQGINPQSILLLTFTRKAAAAMLSRAAAHDPKCEQIDGGTFHSFAFKILKRYGKTIGLENNFTILDSADSNELIGSVMGKLGYLDLKKRFPKKETLKGIISKSINKQTAIKNILEREYPQFEEFNQEITNLRQAYTKAKLEASYVDYDDLLVYLKILLENPEMRQRLASQYQHIMVDEYQDTNKLQGDIAYYLAESHGNIMAVGDDAQSIYGFRGATHQNIMEFPVRFPNCQVIKLEENYRSTQLILDLGNVVLDSMKDKYEKKLAAANKQSGLKPEIVTFKNPYDEATWLAQTIKMMRDNGIDLGKQAVLFRSAFISIPLQSELSKLGIPFQVYGGVKFYETAHVKDLVAYLKIVQNFTDELSWIRILKLIENIGPKTAEKIVASLQNCINLNQVIQTLDDEFGSDFSYSQGIKRLLKLLSKLDSDGLALGDIFNFCFDYYKPLLKKHFDDWHLRLSDLETLQDIAASYESLDSFLSDLALEPPERGVAQVDGTYDEEKPLTLSTIHSAKGLEWDSVFLIGMIEGVLPSRFALNFADQIEEEHRLFYVAVTRAKRQLYLTMHHEGGQGGLYQFNRVSRFLEDRRILEKLEQNMVELSKPKNKRVKLVSDDFEEIDTKDKKTLFEKINESWRM
ncbi:ATP-dependent helicase [Candidatus Beckwithbacteria bacterium]|nr:ATP-dependent helicase [Candidatus Beckwithbacteria bacterium]